MVKQREGLVRIPLEDLEQTAPLGESLVYQDKRPSKGATPYSKIQTPFDFCCKMNI